MPVHGLCLRVTHTGKARASLPLNDIDDGVGRDTGDDRFRRFGPGYVPVDGSIDLVYAGDVAKSFENGTIRKYIETGQVTAAFAVGLTYAAIFPDIEDEGTLLTGTPTSINFVGAGVTATAVGDAVTVTIPGGGAATDHSTLSNLVWSGAGHIGPANTLAAFDGAGAATTISTSVTGDVSGTLPGPLSVTDFTITGEVQGSVLYFDGTNWVQLPPGVAGEVLTTAGSGADPSWSPSSSALHWGADSVGSSTTSRFLFPGFDNSLAQTTAVQYRIPRAGQLRVLRVRHNTPSGNGNNIVYMLRVNGVATALSATLASTGSDASDLVNSVSVSAGDLIDIVVTKAATVGAAPGDVMVSLEYV